MQLLVDEVASWTAQNKMKLNVSKCKELIVQFSKDKLFFAPLVLEGTPVEIAESVKILGLTVQNDMKWHKHIHTIITEQATDFLKSFSVTTIIPKMSVIS